MDLRKVVYTAIGLSAVAAVSLPGAAAAQAPTPAGRIEDFMTMTVCTDAADQPRAGVTPLDSDCTRSRKIRALEAPPYTLGDFAARGGACDNALGVVFRQNLPVSRNGVTRVASFQWNTPHIGCKPQPRNARLAMSVQGYDSQFGYIMGSADPIAQSSFDSPTLCRQEKGGIVRFTRGWVIAPAHLPPHGVPGIAVLDSALAPGNPARLLGTCPTRRHLALTSWIVDDVSFTGGMVAEAVVSDHFSHADTSALSPGDAMQMERTYWTRAFGLTRWEKWARADWSLGGVSAGSMAAALFSAGGCSAPHGWPARMSAGMEAGPLKADGAWSQVLRDPRSGGQQVWFLARCADYTNIRRETLFGQQQRAIPPESLAYWQ